MQENDPEDGRKILNIWDKACSEEKKLVADALVALGSQITFEESNNKVEVSKRKESIIEIPKERF